MLVVLQFQKENEQTIQDVLYSLRPVYKLFCCGSLETLADSLMEKCSICEKRITSSDSKDNEKMWILFILNKKNDRLMLSLLETCSAKVETFKDISKFFDSAKVQCGICLGKSSRKRYLSIEVAAVKTVNPIEVKREPEDDFVQKEKEPTNLQPHLFESALVKAIGPGAFTRSPGNVVKTDPEDQTKEKVAEKDVSTPLQPVQTDVPAVSYQMIKAELAYASVDKVVSVNVSQSVFPQVKRVKIEANEVNKIILKQQGDIHNQQSAGICTDNTNSPNKKHTNFYECSGCNEKFEIRRDLHRHSETHSGEYIFQCSQCRKEFNKCASLYAHVRAKHHGVKFSCDLCLCQTNEEKQRKRTHEGHNEHNSSSRFSCFKHL